MASFTDAISTFNPYVSQIPVDAIVKVGTYKQAQYDQGVQKIQNYIDNIAGMEVLNDADKEYLQSKLNQLGSDLKTVAAGDFSNQQLVNSVGGMASQITKDENIQNAMFSTANAKKQQERIAADTKNGKLNQSSEYIYNRELQKYLSNKEIGQRFTGQYKPILSDWSKKILDTIKVLQPKLTQQDVAYLTNPKTGKVDVNLVAEVMQRYTDKRVDEDQIRTALNAVLNTNDLEQMRMDGIFNYRHYGKEDLANLITEKADQNFELGAARLKQLKTQLPGLTDPDQVLQTKKLIAQYEAEIGDPYMDKPSGLRAKQQQSLADLADPDKLDQLKSQIFLRNTIDEYANAFAYAEVKNEMMTNPVATERRAQRDEAYRALIERNQEYERAWRRRLDTKKEERETAKDKRDQEKHEKEMNPTAGEGPEFTGVGDETQQNKQAVTNWVKDKQSYENQNRSLKSQLKKEMGGLFNDLTDAEVDAKIEAYRKDPAKNKPDDNKVKQLMDSYLANKRYIAKKDIVFNKALEAATKEVTGGLSYEKFLEEDIKGLKGLTIRVGGKNEYFSPTEIARYLFKERSYATIPKSHEGKPVVTIKPGENLTEREKVIAAALRKRYVGDGYLDPLVENTISSYNKVLYKKNNLQNQIIDKQVDLLQPYAQNFKTEGAGITFSGKEGDTKQNFIDKLRNLVSNDKRQEGGGRNYDADELLTTLSQKGADQLLGFGVERAGNAYNIQVQDEKGDFQNVPVSRDWIKKNLGAQWLNKAVETQMQVSSLGGNSNPTDNVELSQYAPNDFGNYDSGQKSVTLDIYANLKDQGNGNAAVTFNLKNKRGEVIPIVWSGRTGITNMDTFPQWLQVQTDATLLARLRTLYPGVDKFLNR